MGITTVHHRRVVSSFVVHLSLHDAIRRNNSIAITLEQESLTHTEDPLIIIPPSLTHRIQSNRHDKRTRARLFLASSSFDRRWVSWISVQGYKRVGEQEY